MFTLWQLDDFVCGKINLSNFSFLSAFCSNVSYSDDAQFLTELVGVRDSELCLVTTVTFVRSELGSIPFQ